MKRNSVSVGGALVNCVGELRPKQQLGFTIYSTTLDRLGVVTWHTCRGFWDVQTLQNQMIPYIEHTIPCTSPHQVLFDVRTWEE